MNRKANAWAETATGAVVLGVAGVFLVYALGSRLAEAGGGGYPLRARFGSVGALAAGEVIGHFGPRPQTPLKALAQAASLI